MLLQNSIPSDRGRLAAPAILLTILLTLMLLASERILTMESAFYDFVQQYNPATPSKKIILVDTATDDSENRLWESDQFGDLFETLNKAGAAVIVPVEAPPAHAPLPDIKQLATLAALEKRANLNVNEAGTNSLNKQLAVLRQKFEQQQAIAKAISEAGNVVMPIMARPTRQALEDAKADCNLHKVRKSGEQSEVRLQEVKGSLTLPDIICQGAASVGHYTYWPDADGIVRRDHLLIRSGDRVFPSLPLAALQAYERNNNDPEAESLLQRSKSFGASQDFSRMIRFYDDTPEQPAFQTIHASDLDNLQQAKDLLADNIVLIGNLSDHSSGLYQTPLNNNIPASMLLATSLSNLMQTDSILRPAWSEAAELFILGFIALAILLSAPVFSANRAVIVTLLFGSILLTLEAYFLMTYGIWLQLVTAAVFSILGIFSIQTLTSLRVSAQSNNEKAVNLSATQTSPFAAEDELDLEFSVLRQQPPSEETKRRLYNIAMAHGKEREYAKAERVLAHLHSLDPDFYDVGDKLEKLSGALKKSQPEQQREAQQDHLPASKQLSNSSQETDSSAERTLGRYIIEKTIGKGAMATVYLGRDPKINRKVAIKTIALAEEFSDEDLQAAKDQFLREAESAGRLNHPSIITIYDTGEDHNVAYLAMEYFPGKALNSFTNTKNRLEAKLVLELMARGAEALHYAHSQGVVHRDIKPANLMYDEASDEFKITDFGIARLTDTSRTKTGIILGTPSYMSPEQLIASNVTGSADLYSLGVTMYQLLAGTTPFRSDSIPQLMDKIINEKHTPISKYCANLPAELDTLMNKILAKRPEDRFQNGRALAIALRDCANKLEC